MFQALGEDTVRSAAFEHSSGMIEWVAVPTRRPSPPGGRIRPPDAAMSVSAGIPFPALARLRRGGGATREGTQPGEGTPRAPQKGRLFDVRYSTAQERAT